MDDSGVDTARPDELFMEGVERRAAIERFLCGRVAHSRLQALAAHDLLFARAQVMVE